MFPHQRWKRELNDRLLADSQVIETTHGMVEAAFWGEGPAVLLMHGTSGGYDQGLGIARLLGIDDLRFIAVSRPGYLRTPLTTGLTPAEQARACAALLDVLGIEQVGVVALSGGAPAGLEFALAYPERCRGMVLISPLVRQRLPSKKSLLDQLQNAALDTDFSDWLLSRELENNPQRLLPNIIHNPESGDRILADPQTKQAFIDLINTNFPASLRRDGVRNDRAQFAVLRNLPLESITCPVIIIAGASELLYADAEYAASTIPQVEMVRSEGGAHLAFLLNSEALVPKVTVFLKSCLVDLPE